MKILFVCFGNICRSPMAEGVLKKMAQEQGVSITVDSAATSRCEIGNPPHHKTRKMLENHQISCSDMIARQVTQQDYDTFDWIIAMDEENLKDLQKMGTPKLNQLHLLSDFVPNSSWTSVPDPWYTGDFEETYRLVHSGCCGILSQLDQKSSC